MGDLPGSRIDPFASIISVLWYNCWVKELLEKILQEGHGGGNWRRLIVMALAKVNESPVPCCGHPCCCNKPPVKMAWEDFSWYTGIVDDPIVIQCYCKGIKVCQSGFSWPQKTNQPGLLLSITRWSGSKIKLKYSPFKIGSTPFISVVADNTKTLPDVCWFSSKPSIMKISPRSVCMFFTRFHN